MNFDIIKGNYERGLWTKAMVRIVVRKGVITTAEYSIITGEEY